ncbi:MAG: tryptophan 7-halogenase [Candidatus Thiodiazotropha sp. (ex Rostrolucina anterorostrata)]|nr:tryptophan 7-halogenase [Candidatus Thiodiazotropha sp. (ex Rostrolucina anterorostrata)]
MTNANYDVIVLGSGPAGSTASTLLSQYGHRVLMLERDRHPRFHIGESLLPMSDPVFTRLGIQWDPREHLPKGGAEFVDENSHQSVSFQFTTEYQPYQVERAKFDLMMAENAVCHGVDLHQEETVKDVEIGDDRVRVITDKQEYYSRYFIDASGRNAFMGRKKGTVKRYTNLGRYSLYTHYRNATSDAACQMYKNGYIKILMLDIGWFWVIPLVENRMSVGIVVQNDSGGTDMKGEELYEYYRQASPTLNEVLMGAEQETTIKTEADFSFTNHQRFGKRYACCGDAAGFLDPVFSSGVFMAVTSAERIADRVHQGLLDGIEENPELHADDDKDYVTGFRSMRLFIERFYQYDVVRNLFFGKDRTASVVRDISGLLSGDLWSNNNSIQKALLDGRQTRKSG